ncbi:MAG TPA: TonB-dependent receptor [Chryseolinea sp.]|nr:TonB-dependent receptor [Chryseolinea sp.]
MKIFIPSCLIFVFLTVATSGYAQMLLSGTVKSAANEELVGVNVYIKGTSFGTSTDVDGTFTLQVPAEVSNPTLTISIIGFISQELVIGQQTNFTVVLLEDETTLGEVVVTGYMVQDKNTITGAVTTVSSEIISKLPLPSIDQALQGRAPGVVVTQNTGAPGEGVAVRIRGAGSINSGNNPLYVVDGVPTLDINSIATQDIASITVLKDAGATAVYGSRAANGVVLVTTKSGGSGGTKIEVSSQVGVQSPSRMIKMADTDEYVSIYNEAATGDNLGKDPILFRPLITEDIKATLPNVSHLDEIFREGVLQSHSLSISGGEGKTRYFISGNYFDQEGIITGSDYNRISSRVNVETEVKTWLRTGVNLNISKATTNIIGSSGDGAGGNGGSVIRYAFFRTPAIPVYTATGEFTDKPSDNYDGDNLYTNLFGDGYSAAGMLAYNNNKLISNRLFGKFFIELTPFKGFKFTSNVGVDFSSANQRRFDRNWGTLNRINNPNTLSIGDNRNHTLTFSNFATYAKSFGSHNFNFLLGTESVKAERYEVLASEKNFPDQTEALAYLGNGLGQKATDENQSGNALLSFFGKVNYDYNGKYLASATIRRDGSSRFGTDNRWGTFYAGSLGWRIDKESFLINNTLIDRLLLRAGYGTIGNQEIGDYPFTDMINTGYNYPLGNTRSTGAAVSSLGNSQVKWESSQQINIGADIDMWEGKLSASLDYFVKKTTDLLVKQPIASSSGADGAGNNHFIWVNNGEIENKGFELIVTYSDAIGNFHYSISANGATLTNKVLQVDAPIPGGSYGSDFVTLTETGHPVGSFYLYETEGIFQNSTDIFIHAFQGNNIRPGDVKYKDQVTDGVINNADRKHIGSPIPKITAGLNINLSYKSWDVSVFFQGAYGQEIFSVLNRDIEGFYRPFNVTQRYYDERWTGSGTSNSQPRASWDASGNNALIYSSRFLEDGSYTRLKNLQLGYTLPKETLGKYGLGTMRIYFSGTNLFTFTEYSGLDPEMTSSNNALGQGDTALGMDWGTYPAAKSYNIGVNLTF